MATDTVDTSTDPIVLTGTSTETGATIINIEYQLNGTGGSWTVCTATDGSFDSDIEGFSCNLSILTDGSYTTYIRTLADKTPTPTANWDPNDANVMDGAISVTVSGNYAYVAGASSNNLAIVDISDPANPTTTANWDPNDGNVMAAATSVTVSGNYAYVTGGASNNLAIVDISDPANPTTTANWDPNDTNVIDAAYFITVSGNYAYVAGYTSDNFAIVDIRINSTSIDNTTFAKTTLTPASSGGSSGSSASSRADFFRRYGNEEKAQEIEKKYNTNAALTAESLTERLNELHAMLAELLKNIPAADRSNLEGNTPNAPKFNEDLGLGSTGLGVQRLQERLVEDGYLTMPQGVPYGYFGPLTRAALAKFQAANNINPPQGYFGPLSRGFLNR